MSATAAQTAVLSGPKSVVERGSEDYPERFLRCGSPPDRLYVIGDVTVLRMPSLSVVGARKATPYGRGCARRFSTLAAARGLVIVSGGARGCDSEAHRAAIAEGAPTVAFLGGGCDRIYPAENAALFQSIIDGGGAVVSERDWTFPPVPYAFRARNRLIASLSAATLIVEAGLPSGTFSTADEALGVGSEVLAVPGSITSASSRGANRLISQGAVPIIDDDTFLDALFSIYGCLRQETFSGEGSGDGALAGRQAADPLVAALRAEPLGMEKLRDIAKECVPTGEDPWAWLMLRLAKLEQEGEVQRYPDGRFGPAVRPLV